MGATFRIFHGALISLAVGYVAGVTFGDDAEVTSWRWQASLQYQARHVCGAVLLSAEWVATGAHCIQDPLFYTVVAGMYDLDQTEGSPERRFVNYVITHPDYDESCTGSSPCRPNDVALLNIQEITDGNQYVEYARLDNGLSDRLDDDCFLTGWGRGSSTGQLENILQEGQMSILSGYDCRLYWGSYISDPVHVCALDPGTLVSFCDGDTGGPLSCRAAGGGGSWDVVGVLSWGLSGCDGEFPAVFARVGNYCDWISAETDGTVTCV